MRYTLTMELLYVQSNLIDSKLLTAALGINWTCHISYNPQSSEQIGSLRKTGKITSDQTDNLDRCPSQVILFIRAMANSGTGLAPHEVLMNDIFLLWTIHQQMINLVAVDSTKLSEAVMIFCV